MDTINQDPDPVTRKDPIKFLICFDVDGVFEMPEEDKAFAGPIPISAVKNLEATGNFDFYIVSESPHYPKKEDGSPLWPVFCEFPSTARYLNMNKCLEDFIKKNGKKPMHSFYVSDNGDMQQSMKAGFTYLTEKLFLSELEVQGMIKK